jgi:hypothetical protein
MFNLLIHIKLNKVLLHLTKVLLHSVCNKTLVNFRLEYVSGVSCFFRLEYVSGVSCFFRLEYVFGVSCFFRLEYVFGVSCLFRLEYITGSRAFLGKVGSRAFFSLKKTILDKRKTR